MRRLTLTALLVKDDDEAIAFYAGKLGFLEHHPIVLPIRLDKDARENKTLERVR